jgi:phage repressor protein C with HTH and peptisase S24 domain
LRVAAGAFIEGDPPEPEHWIDVAAVSRRRKLHSGMFVTQVVGKSMEPVIPDGSYCLFARPVEGTRQGRILLVQKRGISDPDTGGSYTIKRYRSRKIFLEDEQWEHEQIELCPENPEYPVLNIRDVDSNELQVIAEFIEVLRNVK